MRKATDIENRELKSRWVKMSVTGVCVVAALGFVVMVVGPVFPRNIRGWVVVPLIWVILGYWLYFLRRHFRCPVCNMPTLTIARYHCNKCGTQFER